MGESLAAQTITDLPLATRNFQQLLTLSAGASSDLNNTSQLGRGAVYIHVNGGREDNNNYLIEGISASDYAFGELTYTPLPNPDSVQEFKVSTSLYDATQGLNGRRQHQRRPQERDLKVSRRPLGIPAQHLSGRARLFFLARS